jgi:hypothetical protein|nr:MAG TPA: hypothetical protein [Caudoviricetes sp.]
MSIKKFIIIYCNINDTDIDQMLLDGIKKAFKADYDAIYEVYTTMKNHNLDTLNFLLLYLKENGVIM